jgi:Holliday junction DNA helicase RuvA
VSGIGPRLALATLAVLDPDKLRAALVEGNITVLTQVPGIGRKGAERLTLELRDKVSALAGAGDTVSDVVPAAVRSEVIQALAGLGFQARQAEEAVDKVLAEADSADTSTVLRAALKTLGRKR